MLKKGNQPRRLSGIGSHKDLIVLETTADQGNHVVALGYHPIYQEWGRSLLVRARAEHKYIHLAEGQSA